MYAGGSGGGMGVPSAPSAEVGVAPAPALVGAHQDVAPYQRLPAFRFEMPRMNLFGWVRATLLVNSYTAAVMTAVMVLLAILLARSLDGKLLAAALGGGTLGTPSGDLASHTAGGSNVASLAGAAPLLQASADVLQEGVLVASHPSTYQCWRPGSTPTHSLSSADALVFLGDELAANTAVHSALLARIASQGTTTSVRVHNLAGPGLGSVSNVTLQVAALQRDRLASELFASDSTSRVLVVVSLGYQPDPSLPNVAAAMLDSLWHGAHPLVPSGAADRFTVVLLVTPDPIYGNSVPLPAYRADVQSTCASLATPDWHGVKRVRQQLASQVALAALQNQATLVHVGAALGRFSLASATSGQAAFDARCADSVHPPTPSSVAAPALNAKGATALADLLWDCLESRDATYSIPSVLIA